MGTSKEGSLKSETCTELDLLGSKNYWGASALEFSVSLTTLLFRAFWWLGFPWQDCSLKLPPTKWSKPILTGSLLQTCFGL